MSTSFETFLAAVSDCRNPQVVLGEEELIFPPASDFGYKATPVNGLTFGAMGVDGVHYVVLTDGGCVTDDCPVIYVSPMDFDDPHAVLADNFTQFLALACGTSEAEIAVLMERQRSGMNVLVPYLRSHFRLRGEDRVSFLNAGRQQRLQHLLSRIVRKP